MAILLAALAAFTNAVTSVLQRIGVESAPESAALKAGLIGHAVRQKIWLLGFALMLVQFGLQLTAGSDQTSCVVKLYRGATAAGTAIYTSGSLTVAGSGLYLFTAAATDSPGGDFASQIYCVTVKQAGGSANGAVANVWSAITVGE